MYNPKYNQYPVRRNEEHRNNIVPSFNNKGFNVPATIVPTHSDKKHNVAGQIKTRIHLKNARGEEMDIYQVQQVLNLLQGDKSSWVIGGSNASTHTNNRRK